MHDEIGKGVKRIVPPTGQGLKATGHPSIHRCKKLPQQRLTALCVADLVLQYHHVLEVRRIAPSQRGLPSRRQMRAKSIPVACGFRNQRPIVQETELQCRVSRPLCQRFQPLEMLEGALGSAQPKVLQRRHAMKTAGRIRPMARTARKSAFVQLECP